MSTLKVTRLPFWITLYVPLAKRADRLSFGLVQAAGGVTVTRAVGSYIMDDGTDCTETVLLHKVAFNEEKKAGVTVAINEYIRYLLDSGEESVLVETHDGTGLYTKED